MCPYMVGVRRAVGALFLLFSLACSRKEPEPILSEARVDARALEAVLAADMEVETALREVGQVARTDGDKAAGLVDARAVPLADRVVQVADTTPVKSSWGAERKRELLDVARARRSELPRYAAALRSHDVQTELAAVEAQLNLGRRAMEAAGRVTQVPP